MRTVITRITVYEDCVELLIGKQALVGVLTGKPKLEPATAGVIRVAAQDVIKIKTKSEFQRTGRDVSLLLPSGIEAPLKTSPVPSLVKAIARARGWYEKLITGQAQCQRRLAKESQVDERYFSRIFQLAFLAPELVDMIMLGQQPRELTLEKLLDRVPWDWNQQLKHLKTFRMDCRGNSY